MAEKKNKTCYSFSNKRVCQVCGCKDGTCGCETVLEKKKKVERIKNN